MHSLKDEWRASIYQCLSRITFQTCLIIFASIVLKKWSNSYSWFAFFRYSKWIINLGKNANCWGKWHNLAWNQGNYEMLGEKHLINNKRMAHKYSWIANLTSKWF